MSNRHASAFLSCVACATAAPLGGPESVDGSVADAPTVTIDAPSSPTCSAVFSGELAAWSFAGAPGSQTNTVANSMAPGVTASSVSRAATLTAVAGSGSINASGWPTTAQLDATRFFTWSITPPAGCRLRIDSLLVDTRSSGTGPVGAAIATSADGFAQTVPLATNIQSTPALAVTDVTVPLEIRVYGFSATSTAGTLRLQSTLALTGAVE